MPRNPQRWTPTLIQKLTLPPAPTLIHHLTFGSVTTPGSITNLAVALRSNPSLLLLEVNGDLFQTHQFALQTVRPFIFESVRAPCPQRQA